MRASCKETAQNRLWHVLQVGSYKLVRGVGAALDREKRVLRFKVHGVSVSVLGSSFKVAWGGLAIGMPMD